MNARTEIIADGDATDDLEALFAAHYSRVARLIARVTRDPGRAEELAVDVFLKYSRRDVARSGSPEGWLCVTAARMALDELRGQARRSRYEPLLRLLGRVPTPEEIQQGNEETARVRAVLAELTTRQAELLVLRNEGLRYEELAAALGVRAGSVGTLLARAEQAFRKEYEARYGR